MHIPILGQQVQILNVLISLSHMYIVSVAHKEREEDLRLHLLRLFLALFLQLRAFFVRFLRALAASRNVQHRDRVDYFVVLQFFFRLLHQHFVDWFIQH